MGEAGVASLRFDLRGYGESEGRQEDLTLATILNDISALICTAATAAGIDPDRVKFKRAVRVIRRRVDDPAAFPP